MSREYILNNSLELSSPNKSLLDSFCSFVVLTGILEPVLGSWLLIMDTDFSCFSLLLSSHKLLKVF